MGWFSFLKQSAASVPTPSAGKVAIFADATSGEPSYKGDDGIPHSLVGSGGGGVSSLNTRTGAVVLAHGTNMSIVESPTGTFTFNASGGGGGGALPYFYFEDNGAVGDGTTDDTLAIQATLDACGAAGGGVCAPKNGDRTYLISGPLQEGSRSNAQLLLPKVIYASDPCMTVKIMGYTPPGHAFSIVGTGALPGGGTRFKSTLTSGSGSILGGWSASGGANDVTNVHLVLENVVFQTVSNPTISGVDASHCASLDVTDVVVDTGVFVVTSVTLPTTTTSYALRTPTNGNAAFTKLYNYMASGFYNVLEVFEHTDGDNVAGYACVNGLVFKATDHASRFGRVLMQDVIRPIVGPNAGSGSHYTIIQQLDLEHATGGTFATTQDLYDTQNRLFGELTWYSVSAGTPGSSGSFVASGGQNFKTTPLGVLPLVRVVSGTTDTPSIDDNGAIIKCTSSSATSITIAPETSQLWKNGTLLTFLQYGTGQLTIVAGSGVTINTPQSLKTRAQYSMISIAKVDANTFVCMGDMA